MYHYPRSSFVLGVGLLTVVQLSVFSLALLVAVAVQRLDLEGTDRTGTRESAGAPFGSTHTGLSGAIINNEGELPPSASRSSGLGDAGISRGVRTPSTECAAPSVRPGSSRIPVAAHSADSIGALTGGGLRGGLSGTVHAASQTHSSGAPSTDPSTSVGHRPEKGSSPSLQTAGGKVGNSALSPAIALGMTGVRRRVSSSFPPSSSALRFRSPQAAETVSAPQSAGSDSASSWAWEDDFSVNSAAGGETGGGSGDCSPESPGEWSLPNIERAGNEGKPR